MAVRLFLALALAAGLAGCAGREERGGVAVVRGDWGGHLAAYGLERIDWLNRGVAPRIEGICASACVTHLTVPGACVTRGARLGFHGVYPLRPVPPEVLRGWEENFAAGLPEGLRGWWWREARPLPMGEMLWRSGADLIEAGHVPECGSER